MSYKNYMEDVVVDELNGILGQMKDVCRCERCREDIVAHTLNRLSPKYVVTDLGNVYTKLNQFRVQSRTDIIVQLMASAKVVKENPRH